MPAQIALGQRGSAGDGTSTGAPSQVQPGNALSYAGMAEPAVWVPTPAPEPPKRFPAHHLWAALIARIYEVFPLVCPLCGGNMRIIAFITEGVQIRKILEHVGVDTQAAYRPGARAAAVGRV